jgi:RNA polymerase sigma-70 factor (ECF subfamily)
VKGHHTIAAEAVVTDEPAPAQQETGRPPLLLATIREAQAGDSRAFEEIMLATERRVAVLAWRILGDAEEVKEALQETFLRVFRHLGRYDTQRDFFAWLYRIAVNVCRDLQRRRRRRRIFAPIDNALPMASDVHRVDEDLAARDDLDLLTRAIDALPPKERLAIILRDVHELPTELVAAILGSSPATVRVQISKARVKLRLWIESRRGGSGR